MSAQRVTSELLPYLPLLAGVAVLFVLQRGPLWPLLTRAFGRVAERRGLSVLLVAGVATAHFVILALVDWPRPIYADEFSYLLMAETFADGRLTNPTPPLPYLLWAPDVIFEPTYQSKYPPAQGVALLLGIFLGHPLVGVWLSMAAAAAATCWMMQVWLTPRWALVGGLLVATHKAIGTFWGGTYFGGAMAMLGGALLFGSLRRLVVRPRTMDALLMASGVALLANSRPFEGLVASLPAAVLMLVWLVRNRRWSEAGIRRGLLLPIVGLLLLAALGMGVYHQAVTGNPVKMPYQVFLESSQVANVALPGDPQARKAEEAPALIERHFKFFTLGGDPHLWLPLLLLPLVVVRDRWMIFALVTVVLTYLAVWLTVLASPHYAAPVTALIFTLYLACVRFLRVLLRRWRFGFQLFVAVFLTLWTAQLIDSPRFHEQKIGPGHTHEFAVLRAEINDRLEADGGRHMVVIPWDSRTPRVLAWVHNPPIPERADILWAWEGPGLLESFGDRPIWRLDETRWPPELVDSSRAELAWSLRGGSEAGARLETVTESAARIDLGPSDGPADGAAEGPVDGPAEGPVESSAERLSLVHGHPALGPGRIYRWTLRARSDRERELTLRITRGDGRELDGTYQATPELVGPDWIELSFEFRAHRALPHAALELTFEGVPGGLIEVEALDVRVSPEPSSEPSA